MADFQSGRFRFRLASGRELVGLDEDLCAEEFDLRLSESGRMPDLRGAPSASWALARLRFLTELGFPADAHSRSEGGGYVLELVVYDQVNQTVAALQFQGEMQGLAIFGERAADCSDDEILEALAAALLTEPDRLAPCRLSVVDPDWKYDPQAYTPRPVPESANQYGWDGTNLLGGENIRERS